MNSENKSQEIGTLFKSLSCQKNKNQKQRKHEYSYIYVKAMPLPPNSN